MPGRCPIGSHTTTFAEADIYKRTYMKRLLLLVLFVATNSLYASELLKPGDIKKEIRTSCHKGVPVILLFMTSAESDAQSEQDDNELYADWSYYLNEGVPVISDKIKIVQTSVNSGRELFKSKQIPKDMFSLVFVPCNKKALYSESAILEPDVYKYMKLYFENKEKDLMLSNLLETHSANLKDKAVTPESLGLEYIDIPR